MSGSIPWSPDAVERFCALLSDLGAGEMLGVATKLLHRPKGEGQGYSSPGWFQWVPAGQLASEVTARVRQLAAERNLDRWDYVRRCGGPAAFSRTMGTEKYPGEVMVRLVTCAEPPLSKSGWHRGGTVNDVSTVLAFHLDVDVSRGEEDERSYCPDVGAAVDLWSSIVPPPSLLIDGGAGVMGLWLLREPWADATEANLLGKDLKELVGQACAHRRWTFDSADPVTAWLKVPGTYSMFRQHVVSVIGDSGRRWSWEDLRDATPELAPIKGHSAYSGDYEPAARRMRRRPGAQRRGPTRTRARGPRGGR